MLKETLAAEFDLKDLGFLKYFLGIKVARSNKGIVLSQRKYILDLLSETGMYFSQHMQHPNTEHLEMVTRILRYLKGSPGLGLFIKKHNNRGISIYTDTSCAGELTDRRSSTGYY